jgi:hypothetical protein
MAVMKIRSAGAPQPEAAPSAGVVAAGKSGKPLVRSEAQYSALAVFVLVVGFGIGLILDDDSHKWLLPEGIDVFAVFFVAAQAIERLLEPIAPFFGRTQATAPQGLDAPAGISGWVTKSEVVKARDAALASAANASDAAPGEIAAKQAAWLQELLEQIRRNTGTLWAVGAALGMVAAGWWGLLLLHGVGLTDVSREADIFVTGLAIGGGTKPLHDLIENVKASKEAKQNPKEADGQSAS